MQSDWMKTRQTRYSLYLTVYLLVILAILGATNWLANGHNKSFDSTSNKKFSLSDQTVKVVKGLTKDVTITDYDKTSSFTTAPRAALSLLVLVGLLPLITVGCGPPV